MALELKGEVKVGPSSGIKRDAVNAAEEIARQAKEEAVAVEVAKKEAVSGSLLYKAVGYPAFIIKLGEKHVTKTTPITLILNERMFLTEDNLYLILD